MSATPLPGVPTTKILAIGRPSASGTMEAIAPLRPEEVRATVALHLAGLIEQWWFQIRIGPLRPLAVLLEQAPIRAM